LVVVSTESNNHQDDVHTDDSTDYPTSATGRFITDILDEDDDHDDDDASHNDMSTSTDGDEITDHEDDDVITTDDEDLNTLPRHLLTAAGTISIADTEAESTTPLTGLERTATADDETTEATTSPSSANVAAAAAAAAAAIATIEQQSDDVVAITPNREEEVKTADTSAAAHHVVVPTKMANEGSSSMKENERKATASNPTGTPEEEKTSEIEDRTAAYSRGNSIGLAYDIPIESESDGTEADNTSEQNETNEPQNTNTDTVAAGVVAVAGAVTAGAIAAGVLEDDQPNAFPTKPLNDTTISDISEGTMPVPLVVKSTSLTEAVSPMAADRDVSTPKRTRGGVAAMISLFDKKVKHDDDDESSTESNEIPITNETSLDAGAINVENSEEQVHLLDGFTTEEDCDTDNLFKPDIPQNLKAAYGMGAKGGDSQYEGIKEHESVQTMEFPPSDDDMPTAASPLDNVVVGLLEETSLSVVGGNADPQASANNTDKKEEHLASKSNHVIVGTDAKEAPAKTREIKSNPTNIGDIGIAEDVPADSAQTKTSLPVMSDATSSDTSATNAADDVDNFDSWRTDDTQDEEGSNSFLPTAKEQTSKQKKEDLTDVPMTFPSLLGTGSGADWENNSDTEGEPLLPDRKEESDTAAPREGRNREQAAPEMSYKIGSTYFLLRERDGIEYPVKILSLGKRGTCIVEYEHHRAKKNIRTSSLLPDTPARREKFEEQMNSGEIATDLPARISKELKQKQTERHARHEERRKYGHHISRDDLPTCSTAGTVLDFKSRRVYFAKDKETVREIGKKFNVSSDRIVYDNKVAYPSLKKTSKLRPLTSIVLPPA
jgi:hypothetical protein